MIKIKQILSKLIVPAITIILIGQLMIMTREITWSMIVSTVSDVAWWQVMLLIICGLVAIVPTIFNDIILARWQQYDIRDLELLQRGWLVNVFNINAGFVGIVSLLLRRVYYFDQKKSGRLKPYLQVYILGLSGLLAASFLALLVLSCHVVLNFEDKMIWLALIILIAIVVIFVTKIPKFKFWEGINKTVVQQLSLTSVVAFIMQMSLFVLIGIILGVHLPISLTMIVYIIASAVAFVTMTPGTWGSFDVAVILILSNIDISKEQAVVWLILYRVVYNIIPLLSAIGLFIYRISYKINAEFRGVPHYVARAVMHHVTTVMLYLVGFLLVLSGTMPTMIQRVTIINQLRSWPITFTLATQLPNILLGFLLLISARGVASRVNRSYQTTLILLGIIFLYAVIEYRHVIPIIFIGVALIAFSMTRKTLYRKQFIHSWEAQVVDGVIWGILIVSYLLLGLMNTPILKHHFHHAKYLSMKPSMHWWVMGVVVIFIVMVFSIMLSRYLEAHRQQLGDEFDELRIQQILSIGDTHYSNLAFLGDKRFYYYQVDQKDCVALQFRTINNKLMVMGDPFGQTNYFSKAIQQFIEDADVLGYVPVFYEVSERVAMIVHEFGYDFFKLGEEAQVILEDFSTAGKKMQNVRSVVNQAERGGFEFHVIHPPFNTQTMQQLQVISQEWLAGREEKGFSLGFFDVNYLQRYPIAILEKNGQIEAYATLTISHTEKQMAVDLMRFTKKAPNGVMDVLFVHTIAYAKSEGLQTLNLGMSPLANVGQHRQSFSREKLANLVYQFGSRVYSFEGLHHYKSKFTQHWVPMYIAYSRKSLIAMVMIGLLKIDNKGVEHAPKVKFVYDKY